MSNAWLHCALSLLIAAVGAAHPGLFCTPNWAKTKIVMRCQGSVPGSPCAVQSGSDVGHRRTRVALDKLSDVSCWHTLPLAGRISTRQCAKLQTLSNSPNPRLSGVELQI
jgi:hypothetical protein